MYDDHRTNVRYSANLCVPLRLGGKCGANSDNRRAAEKRQRFAELKLGHYQANDFIPLRRAGLSDHAIHDVVAIVSYFNFVNRIASGLGVDLEWADKRS